MITPSATFYYKFGHPPRSIQYPTPPLTIHKKEGSDHRPWKCTIDEPEEWKPESLAHYRRWLLECKKQLS